MKKLVLAIVMLFSFVSYAQARMVDDVNVPDTYLAGNSQLILNGAGVRSKWFIDLYVGGLYLTKANQDAQAIIDADEPMAISMHIITSLISDSKMQSATMEGFENSTNNNIKPIKAEVDKFISLFKGDINKGDIFTIVYEPQKGIELYRNNKLLGTVGGGLAFKKAVFGIWLCDKPAQKDLKQEMLGKKDS
ncbi:chalcone isomerase family protein [Mangrovitalea sediminis]|uniref:chalcone isomerase family protein n=1 Tax=Mangrovitalea sediminis TaxID=1982043 RepID=UPI000BE4FDDA|nr:chalcone isomerase family protein [Mangrovitalea sediminis]